MGCQSSKPVNPSLTGDEILDVLRNLNIFVLDNSIRESTVAQTRGHVKSDKYTIWNTVRECGIDNCIVATFGLLPSVEDEWLKELDESKVMWDGSHGKCYAFSELFDGLTKDTRPKMTIPIGLSKILKYKVPNCIFEVNINWEPHMSNLSEIEALKLFKELIINRMKVMRQFNPNAIVFINYRDSPNCFQDPICRKRIQDSTTILATLETSLRPNGILFEDASGEVWHFLYKELVSWIKNAMVNNGWKDGHILVHIHKNFGMAESSVLECLSHGATGVWCGVSEEGAATGSAGSLLTLTNLARLGNTYVASQFNFPKLHQAAITITKLSTGEMPHPKQEIYGTRALDLLWLDGMGGASFDLDTFFGYESTIRITTFTTPDMFRTRLVQVFGYTEYDWDITVCTKMQWQLREDLIAGQKFDYQSALGLLDLYQRSGGVQHIEEMLHKCNAYEEIPDDHNLIVQAKAWFDGYDIGDGCADGQISYEVFYHAFLIKYVSCYSCEKFREIMRVADMDRNGYIHWNEIRMNAKWAISEFPQESMSWDLEELFQVIFERRFLPDAMRRILEKRVHVQHQNSYMSSDSDSRSSYHIIPSLHVPTDSPQQQQQQQHNMYMNTNDINTTTITVTATNADNVTMNNTNNVTSSRETMSLSDRLSLYKNDLSMNHTKSSLIPINPNNPILELNSSRLPSSTTSTANTMNTTPAVLKPSSSSNQTLSFRTIYNYTSAIFS